MADTYSIENRGYQLLCGLAAAASLIVGCEAERPRSYSEYLDDAVAREATLVRCNANREATRLDAECVNARRAAAALAVKEDGDKRERLQEESDRKRAALRQRIAAQQAAQAAAAEAAQKAADEAYEARWVYPGGAKQESGGQTGPGWDGPVRPSQGPSSFQTQSIPPGVSRSEPSGAAQQPMLPQPAAGSVDPYAVPSAPAPGVNDVNTGGDGDAGGPPSQGMSQPVSTPQTVVPDQPVLSAPTEVAPATDAVPVPQPAADVPPAEEVGPTPVDPSWQPFEPPTSSDATDAPPPPAPASP